jgi:hypothetical protein
VTWALSAMNDINYSFCSAAIVQSQKVLSVSRQMLSIAKRLLSRKDSMVLVAPSVRQKSRQASTKHGSVFFWPSSVARVIHSWKARPNLCLRPSTS